MSKRNGTVTDDYDISHRRMFVRRARGTGRSRQVCRSAWARIIKRQAVARELRNIFDEVSGVIAGDAS